MPQLSLHEATEFFKKFYGGEHHIPNNEIIKWGYGWCVKHDRGDLATYDFNKLTTLVVMAHDFCIRVEITAIKPSILRIAISKREREGGFSEKHPELESHVAEIRERLLKPNQ